MSKIVEAVPGNDYTISIELDNHQKIIYDLKPRLCAVRFLQLADIEKFKDLKIENGNTLVWDNLCQITIDEIFSTMER